MQAKKYLHLLIYNKTVVENSRLFNQLVIMQTLETGQDVFLMYSF